MGDVALERPVQAACSTPTGWRRPIRQCDITEPFPFNAFYPIDDAPEVEGDRWGLEVSGLVAERQPWTLERLRTLPQKAQITRHICIEGWSAIGDWRGVPFRDFLAAHRCR